MAELTFIVAVTAATFVTTNLDNLGLLIILIAEQTWSLSEVMWGFLISAVVAVGVAWVLAEALELGPDRHLAYLGLVPITLGVYRAWRLFTPAPAEATAGTRRTGIPAVAVIMLAQSGDSVAVYVSLFADTREHLEPAMLITLAVCTMLWFLAARWLATHRFIADPLERWGRYLLPVLLIAIGVLILMDTPTDVQ